MYTPSRDEFLRMAAEGNTIPVYRTLLSDHLTPVLAFRKLLAEGEQGFLLESIVGMERIARYTFLGVRPRLVVRALGRRISGVRRIQLPYRARAFLSVVERGAARHGR